uniref:Thiamin pyrophosphokinase 2 n=1 Tax=Cynoglossus semilaevis TaxID=244447 RepID=A0A3P8UWQ3_CYNSE
MAVYSWSEKVMKLLSRMNNFYLAGSCRADCCRFEIEGSQVGWIPPHVTSLLTGYPEVFSSPNGGAVSLCPSLDSYQKRSEAVDAVLQSLRGEDSLGCLKGWRDEEQPNNIIMKHYFSEVQSDSSYHNSGEVSMWLGRRSPTKQTYPGLLDNLAAGGLSADVSIKHTLVKECQEEACIPAAIAEKALHVSTVSYTYEDEEGVFPECQFVFDLELPLDFRPRVGDGEVQEFYLLPIDKVKELLATDDFKPNCAMVALDFLIRHSFIDPDTEPFYQEFLAGLHQTL